MALTDQTLEAYLSDVLGAPVRVLRLSRLDHISAKAPTEVKGYGYGVPIRVEFQREGGMPRSAVLHTITPGPFGHEHMADRAQELLWEHRAFNRLPRHVRSLDVGGIRSAGRLVALGDVEEFCLLTEYVDGESYANDLERLLATGDLGELDVARAAALCDYLVQIHSVRGADPGLYVRRIRELIGHGECIMGLVDNYPPHAIVTAAVLEDIERRCLKWRWRLKGLTHRLVQVHGDFHPWNILFREGVDFQVLDRSRGEFGDAADDVACLTMNYVFFSLQRSGRLEGCFETLFRGFWDRYLERSGDHEMLRVIAPFLVFRCVVMAHPVWYPDLAEGVRKKLMAFSLSVLERDDFSPSQVNAYCGA
ncbi:MAG: aminoglycoside phosphotransferase family protein [Bryobacterales bacterium]|nr:aminoglycoside phosphotransferase family protein [Bryobacterales bacterium]MBV9401809.1 aminoglycoside phosphotransferase family protein [Bryobacterales bacterium]